MSVQQLKVNQRSAKKLLKKVSALYESRVKTTVPVEVCDFTVSWFKRPVKKSTWDLNSIDLLRLKVVLTRYIKSESERALTITLSSLNHYPVYSKEK